MRAAVLHPFEESALDAVMKKHFAVIAGTLIVAALFAGEASAQGIPQSSRHSIGSPTVSPYLNLLTSDAFGNIGIGGGYQTLVRPMVDGRKAINANSAAISQLQAGGYSGRGGGAVGGAVGAIGKFRNYSHYYPSMPGR
jgi:hypothetical protein